MEPRRRDSATSAAARTIIFVGMHALDLAGYEPNVDQTTRVIWTIKTLYFILPAVCFATSCYLLRYYPITQQEHGRIRAKIEAKKIAEAG